jgi:thiamine-monophosphate kinase
MLSGGDDYELLLTAPPARMPKLWELARQHGWDVYDIGEVRSADEGLRVLDPLGKPLEGPWPGWQHFVAVARR